MPSSFFILLRYFLRVDNVLIKINDTRLYHEFENNYIIREYTSRESKVDELKVGIYNLLTGEKYHNLFIVNRLFFHRFPLRYFWIQMKSAGFCLWQKN